jgi:peptidyl-prolyl cis-trans isomerase D
MLDVFREGAKTWVSRFFVWMIAMTFVAAAFMVWGQKGAQRASSAAVVADQEISRAELYQRTRVIENNIRAQLGGQMEAGLLKSLDPKSMALSALIEEALMRQAAGEAGVYVSDEEVRDAVMGMKEFLTDGVFDRRKYQDLLKLNELTPSDFEVNIRQSLLAAKFRSMARRAVHVSEAEALDAWLKENQTQVVEYVEAPEEALKKEIKPTGAELAEWYAKHNLDFETPAKRKVRIITAFPAYFEMAASVTDDEAKKYFEAHKGEFAGKESVEASHILAKVSPGAPAESDKAAREKAEKALARVQAGEDFGKVAKETSEDPSAPAGGSLGRFSKGQMVPAFEDAAFALKNGEVSKPVKTPFGWHIIKVTNKFDAGSPAFDQVKDYARIKAKKKKAADDAHAAILGAADKITAANFDEKANSNSRLRHDALLLQKDGLVPDVQDSALVMDVIFGMEKGKVSSVIKLPEGYALLALDEIIDPKSPPLEEAKPRIMERYAGEKAKQLSKERAEKIEKEVRSGGKTLAQAAESAGLAVKVTPAFSTKTMRPAQGETAPKEAGMTREALLLGVGEMKTVAGPGGYTVIRVKERPAVDYAKAALDIVGMRHGILAMKTERAMAEMVKGMRKRAEEKKQITIFEKVDKPQGADMDLPIDF